MFEQLQPLLISSAALCDFRNESYADHPALAQARHRAVVPRSTYYPPKCHLPVQKCSMTL